MERGTDERLATSDRINVYFWSISKRSRSLKFTDSLLLFHGFLDWMSRDFQGHPTNLFLTLSVPQRNLAGWQKYTCPDAKFVIDRGFGWELLTFSSISTRAGCRNSEDLSSWVGNFLCVLLGKRNR